MAARVYISPIVGAGTRPDPYLAQAAKLAIAAGLGWTSFLPATLAGAPASPWALTVVRGADFTTLAADPTLDDLFAGDLPAGVTTRDELLAFLRGRTVGQVPLARRNAITAVLDKYAVPRTDFTAQTPLWKVMQRVLSTLLERDDSFGAAF